MLDTWIFHLEYWTHASLSGITLQYSWHLCISSRILHTCLNVRNIALQNAWHLNISPRILDTCLTVSNISSEFLTPAYFFQSIAHLLYCLEYCPSELKQSWTRNITLQDTDTNVTSGIFRFRITLKILSRGTQARIRALEREYHLHCFRHPNPLLLVPIPHHRSWKESKMSSS
jgi:hypothetical protein